MKSYVIDANGNLKRVSNEIDPIALTAWYDKIEQGEADLPPIRERLDALLDALYDEGWTPLRTVRNEIEHLDNVISGHFLAKYLAETLTTLDCAEIDLASWRNLAPDKKRGLAEAHDRAEAELAARRKAREAACARKAAIIKRRRKPAFQFHQS
jgi:hypothetical protein